MDIVRGKLHALLAVLSDALSSSVDGLSTRAVITRIVLAVLAARILHKRLFTRATSLRYLPGPPNTSWLRGNPARTSVPKTREWQKVYGHTFKTHTLLGTTLVFTSDPTAIAHVVNSDRIYQKAPVVRWTLTQLLGRGLLALEDDEHTKLRKIMSPAFSQFQVRLLTPLFLDKSLVLVSVWSQLSTDDDGWAHLNVMKGLKAVTLDIIGMAGFNYEFNALHPEKGSSALDSAFRQVFETNQQRNVTVMGFLRARFAWLRPILPSPSKVAAGRRAMLDIGMQLLQDAKKEAEAEGVLESEATAGTGRRDLLSLLVKSNLSENEAHRLSDADVVSQIPTFFVAGHETTSTAVSWALYAVAAHPDVQRTLRAELAAMGTDAPTLDALNALHYLDCVVREVMRLHAPVAFTTRMATRDDVVPLATAYTDTRGVLQESIRVAKGQTIYVPIGQINRDDTIWGEDSDEFRPERWDALPSATNAIPGVYSHLFSFLGGPHNCIGWRFSVAEMKCIIYTLIRNFEFELEDGMGKEDIVPSDTAVQRPTVKGKKEEGNQLPLKMRRVQ